MYSGFLVIHLSTFLSTLRVCTKSSWYCISEDKCITEILKLVHIMNKNIILQCHHTETPGAPHPTLPTLGHQELRVKWNEQWGAGHPTLPILGHQELRVKWDEQWGAGHPTLPTLGHQELRVKWDEQWGAGHPTPTPLVIRSWELSEMSLSTSWTKTLYCSAGILRPQGFGQFQS